MTFFNKLNANERLVAIGAAIVVLGTLVGVAGSFGYAVGTLSLLAAIAVVVIYFLKYSPTQNVSWPAPVPTIVLVISAIAAVFSILTGLPFLAIIGTITGIGVIVTVVGTVIMAWGAWQDYQAMPKTTPPSNPPV